MNNFKILELGSPTRYLTSLLISYCISRASRKKCSNYLSSPDMAKMRLTKDFLRPFFTALSLGTILFEIILNWGLFGLKCEIAANFFLVARSVFYVLIIGPRAKISCHPWSISLVSTTIEVVLEKTEIFFLFWETISVVRAFPFVDSILWFDPFTNAETVRLTPIAYAR